MEAVGEGGDRKTSPCPAQQQFLDNIVGETGCLDVLRAMPNAARWERGHLDDASRAARQPIERPGDWHRLVLYALADALAYNFLLVGTLAAYLQEQGLEAELLRRHLQSPDPDRYIIQEALDLLAGLTGRLCTEGEREPTWHFIGRQIAECGVQRGE